MIDFRKYIKEGKNRCDLSSLFLDHVAFNEAIKEMSEPFRLSSIDKVVALDSLGFVFGSRIAQELDVGLILFRKEGKIPVAKKIITFTDYTKIPKAFEVISDAITSGDRVLIIDEWSETGSQIKAAVSLVEQCGGIVAGISCFNIDISVKKDKELSKYKIYSLI